MGTSLYSDVDRDTAMGMLEEMKRLKDLKVDGIITDYPDLFAQLGL